MAVARLSATSKANIEFECILFSSREAAKVVRSQMGRDRPAVKQRKNVERDVDVNFEGKERAWEI